MSLVIAHFFTLLSINFQNKEYYIFYIYIFDSYKGLRSYTSSSDELLLGYIKFPTEIKLNFLLCLESANIIRINKIY